MAQLVNISQGNAKLGPYIPSVSTMPGRDCGNCGKCVKDCYAVRITKHRPNVRKSWQHNGDVARTSQRAYFRSIHAYLRWMNPTFFRFHVAGDILDQTYLRNMIRMAKAFPRVKFLAFTKMHHLDFTGLPENLSVVASMWPGLEPHPNVEHLPKAWMQDGTEERVPETAIPCPGRCEECGMCWSLKGIGRDVVFRKHR